MKFIKSSNSVCISAFASGSSSCREELLSSIINDAQSFLISLTCFSFKDFSYTF